MDSVSSLLGSHASLPLGLPLSNANYSPTNYKPLYGQRTETDRLEIRLQTFIFWPSWAPATLNVVEMARTGLYYTGDGDQVRCFRCSFTFKDWQDGDNPKTIHQSESPRCHLLLEDNDGDDSGEDEDFVDCRGSRVGQPKSEATSFQGQKRQHRRANSTDSDCDSEKSDCESLSRWDAKDWIGSLNENRERSDLESYCSSRSSPTALKNDKPNKNNRSLQINGSSHRFTMNVKQRLKEENEKLRKAMTCRKCNAEKSQTLFLPCRHLVTCEQCAEEMDDCVLCQTKILGTVRIFMT